MSIVMMCGYEKSRSKCVMDVSLKMITTSYTEKLPQYPAVGKKTTSSAVVQNAELSLRKIVQNLVCVHRDVEEGV